MGLGELLNGWNDSINNFIADHNDSYDKWLQQDRARAQAENAAKAQQQDHPSFFKAFSDNSSSEVAGMFAMAGAIPHFDDAMRYLDSGRRAADTVLITAKHAGAVSNKAGGSDSVAWAELLNKDNWSRAWDIADYNNINRATGGNVIASKAFGHNDQIETLDPFDAVQAKAIQLAANDTWYGQTTSALVDLGTSFISPPGLGLVSKGAKAARAVKAPTVVGADAAAERLAQIGVDNVPDVTVGMKARDIKDNLLGRPQDADSILARQMAGMRELDGITDHTTMVEALAGKLEGTPEATVHNLADMFVQINKMPGDRLARDKVRMNLFLSGFGSKAARAELAKDNPLLAASFMRVTGQSTNEVSALTELYSHRLNHPDADLPVNEIIDNTWGTAADKVEEEALRTHISSLADDAAVARQLYEETRAAKPGVIGTPDAAALHAAREQATKTVNDLTAKLQAERAGLKGQRRWAAATAGAARDGLDAVTAAGRDAGAAAATADNATGAASAANQGVRDAGRGVREAGVQRNWVEAEFRQAKAMVREVGKKSAPADLKAKVAALGKELDDAQKAQDSARVASAKAKIVQEIRRTDVKSLDKSLVAQADAAAKTAQDTYASSHLTNVADFNQSLGEARGRISEIENQLAQARSDRDLLHSTPMPGKDELAGWRQDMADVRQMRKDVGMDRRWHDALLRQNLAMQAAKRAEINAARPNLNRANEVLTDILTLGKDPSAVISGGMEGTVLQALKKNVRDRIGAEHYVFTGEGNSIVRMASLPNRKARQALAPQARGAISLTEKELGRNQFTDMLARSGVFTKDEIHAASNAFIAAKGNNAAMLISRYNEQMIEKMAKQFLEKDPALRHLTPEEAAAHAREITGLTTKVWGKGRHWVATKASEQVKNKIVTVRDIDGLITGFDEPMLRSHLADNAPVLDPWDLKRALQSERKNIVNSIKLGVGVGINAHDFLVQIWKVGALVRPALLVRAMLDTGPRMLASLTALEAMTAGISGAANLMHNARISALTKAHLTGLAPDEAAAKMRALGLKPVVVKTKGGQRIEHVYAKDMADLHANSMATTKGNSPHSALFNDMKAAYNGVKMDRAAWSRLKAESAHWHLGYQEYSQMLLASPTVRKLTDLLFDTNVGDIDALRRSLKNSDEFRTEYAQLAQKRGVSREAYLDHLINQVDMMFPNERVLNAAKNHGLTQKFIDEQFPRDQRFNIPSPEISVVNGWADKSVEFGKRQLDRAFRNLLDRPDMWLARNPVAVMVYNRTIKNSYEELAKRYGEHFHVDDAMQAAIDRKARQESISYVRRTFFDTTRFTHTHRVAAHFAPFFAAWEDAMQSWARLLYDDPRRLVKLTAAYYSPYTIANSTGNPIMVDENHKPITRGSNPAQAFINVPKWAIQGLDKIPGVDMTGVSNYYGRLSSLNSIWQGETWWMPGAGPTVSVPLAYILGNDKLVDRKTALDLVGTDNWFGQQVLKSMYIDGELPPGDAKSLLTSTLPGWARNYASETLGTGKARNRQTNFNFLVGQALANGDTLSSAKYQELWNRADKAANAAAVTRLVAGGVMGITGNAAVDGQFYADQMHIIQAMPPEARNGKSPEEYFSGMYPEAADLDWSITKNNTGIVASVRAAKSQSNLSGMLKSNNDDLGWMILGADNVVDPEFSRTVHGMQRAAGDRTYKSAEKAQQDAQAAVGWRQYNAYQQRLLDTMKQLGLDENSKEFTLSKTILRQQLMQQNPAWARDYTEKTDNFTYYYSQAQRLATSSQLGSRSDMVKFKSYDKARTEVMQQLGIQSLTGTTDKYVVARAALKQLGDQYAADDFGFQQMWQKFLGREVEEKEQ